MGEVESLLGNLGHLTFDGELHVVGGVRDDLSAGDASQHHEVVRKLHAGNLGVDDGLDLDGDKATGLEVGSLIATGGVLVGEDGAGSSTLLHTALDLLAELGALVLVAADLLELLFAGQLLGTCAQACRLADQRVVLGALLLSELDVAAVGFTRFLFHLVEECHDFVLTLQDL